MGDLQQRGEKAVPLGLGEHAVARVDQDDGQFGRGGAGDHVARVLDVAGRVRDDELAPGRGEVAIGHIDGDALLALGAQPIGQQRQVDIVVAALQAGPFDRFHLILKDRLGVVKQPANQRALAVIHTARRGETQQIHREVGFAVMVGWVGIGDWGLGTGDLDCGSATSCISFEFHMSCSIS